MHDGRAVVLLLVLALVAGAVPIIVLAVSRSTAAVQRTRSFDDAAIADDLLVACSAPIRDWLRRDANGVVQSTRSTEPVVPVLSDRFEFDGRSIELVTTAWDLQGMLPADAFRAGTPLRLTLPEDVRRRLDELTADPTGLDNIQSRDGGRRVFPSPGPGVTAVGAYVSTSARPSAKPVVRLNVNTTPAPLLENAMRLTGRGGFDEIMERRARGEPGGPPPLPVRELDGSPRVALGGSSGSWGIRIDIRVDSVRRSWWTVWTRVSGDWVLQRRTPILWEPHPEHAP